MMNSNEARELARKVVGLTDADEAEALVIAEESSLTRFANNRINQNVSEANALVSVRAVLGKRIGVASTNRLDDHSLAACCESAVAAARLAMEDEGFPGLPGPQEITAETERVSESTLGFSAEDRANAASAIIGESRAKGFTAAGKVRSALQTIAVANSKDVAVGGSLTGAQATVLSMGADQGSGWASFLSRDAAELDGRALGAEAADIAERSANPGELEAGEYPVVLGPEAVADLMDFLSYTGFSAKAYEEGRSFLSNHIQDQVMNWRVSIFDDGVSEHSMGLPFDFEGMPKRRTPLIEYGVAIRPVTDSYWAQRSGWPNSGNALPAPNPYGPMPLNIEMMPGEENLDQLIEKVEHGVYVTRFHYVNVEDPVPVLLTGMTRDGTFLIEDGKLTRPLKNLRFTQSALEALNSVEAVTEERKFVGTEMGASLVPGVLCLKFRFTGQTS